MQMEETIKNPYILKILSGHSINPLVSVDVEKVRKICECFIKKKRPKDRALE